MIVSHQQNTRSGAKHCGKVYLAAAGPGDPDLITVKAADALRSADVVLTDRLVSEEILHRYVPAMADIVYVGKECRKKVSTPQQTINTLIAKYALQGKTVVRLKGGDVSVFSNILDELEVLAAHNIPYEIIPGVTAALGAAAYSGIPLTARGYSTAVRFLTYYKSDVVTEDYWQELAKTSDTLVFYMSAATIATVVEKLQQYGISNNVQLAVAEQATTCFQKIHTCNIYEFNQKFAHAEFISPSLVIIGRVVALHEQFNWFANEDAGTNQYFAPVAKRKNDFYKLTNAIKNVV
ncbi:MAG: uroporphyrinogen-III C-methyltransferase [Niabella sp.]